MTAFVGRGLRLAMLAGNRDATRMWQETQSPAPQVSAVLAPCHPISGDFRRNQRGTSLATAGRTVPRMINVNWIRVRHLCGETLREVGTLVFVFAPLEAAFAEQAIHPDLLATVILGSLAAIMYVVSGFSRTELGGRRGGPSGPPSNRAVRRLPCRPRVRLKPDTTYDVP